MSKRFPIVVARLRALLLGAGFSAGALYFWLGAHEAFEGPKLMAALIYGMALLACSAPLLWARAPQAWARHRGALLVGGLLLAAMAASLLGGWMALPGNQGMIYERSLPLLLAALMAAVFLVEDPAVQRKALFMHLTAHVILLFYGAIQVLDQTWGNAHGASIDPIRWVRFGESRVYSTLGNPDYMAAHLTLLGALWLGLGWRRLPVKAALQAAAAALFIVPLIVVPVAYGVPAFMTFLPSTGYWFGLTVAAFIAGRRLAPRTLWAALLGLLGLLVVLAQGRGAWLAAAASLSAMALGAVALAGPAFFRQRWALLRWPLGLALVGLLGLGALLGARHAAPEAPWAKQGAVGKVLATFDALADRSIHIFDKADDAQVVRRFYWQSAWELGKDHPILGIGYGNHALLTAQAQSTVWKRWLAAGDPRARLVEPHVELYTHDDYLQNFAETGLVGLAAFLAFWAFIVAGAWSLARAGARTADARRLELGLGLLGLAVAFGVNALTNFPWRVLATQQLSWLALAILAAELARLPGSREAVAATAGTVMDTAGSAGTSGKTGRDGSRPYRTLPGWAWAMVSVLCFVGALYGARWFFATLLFKQGNLRKDQSQAELQVQGLPYYEAAARAGLSPTMQVEAYLYLGSLYNLAGRPDLAETWFKRGIGRYPDFLEAWYNLGYTYQRRYEADHDLAALKQAVDCYRKVLALNPRASAAATNLGNLLYQQGAYAEAGALYDNLLSFAPDSPEARYNLAAVSIRLNDRKKAVVQLDLLLAKHPDFAPAVTLRKQLGR